MKKLIFKKIATSKAFYVGKLKSAKCAHWPRVSVGAERQIVKNFCDKLDTPETPCYPYLLPEDPWTQKRLKRPEWFVLLTKRRKSA